MMDILTPLKEMFPNAGCELNYHNEYELLVAIILSAQTTDVSVNKVTPKLFASYPDIVSLSKADMEDVINIIKPIGLSKNKSQNIINMARLVCEKYGGKIPRDFNSLLELSGVGRKTANVYLSLIYHEPHIAVDTHVFRVSKRLGIASEGDSLLTVEEKLMEYFLVDDWITVHHLFLFLGRYTCLATRPMCCNCKLTNFCQWRKMHED